MPDAIIWDFDGTLADTTLKNLVVTRRIYQALTGADPLQIEALTSEEKYLAAIRSTLNWRELYRRYYHLSEEQIDQAGRMWTEYQLADQTPVKLYPGLPEVLAQSDGRPNGVVSQNSRGSIIKVLQEHKIIDHFGCIIGYEEVGAAGQKPAPEGLLQCIRELLPQGGKSVVYIGDHDTDIRCARNADQFYRQRKNPLRIVSIGVQFAGQPQTPNWSAAPDHVARSSSELLKILRRLP